MGRASLLVDTGPLVAYLDAGASEHSVCAELLETHPGPILVPTLCVAEVAHLLSTHRLWDGEIRFLGDLAAGTMTLEPVHPADLLRIGELIARYRDLPLGTVDASIVAAAERLDVPQLATLDRRDFSVVRPAHIEAFELLP